MVVTAAPANKMRVEIDTIPRGTSAASVDVWLSAQNSSVGAKARIFDYTDNVACTGESSVVTTTTPTKETFPVTLTNGSHDYGLQLLINVVNEDFYATAIYVR